jgi:hypothetical protein
MLSCYDVGMEKTTAISLTPVTPEALIARGYVIVKDTLHKSNRIFQKRFDDDCGKKYFLTFSEWVPSEELPIPSIGYESECRFETSTDGYVWITIKESTIEAVETLAEALWVTTGSVYYE